MSADSAVWVYTAVLADEPPALAAGLEGVPGATSVRTTEVTDGVWLVVSDVPLDAYDADAVEAGLRDLQWVSERATAHERVVEAAAAAGTAVPTTLFTLFTSERSALEAFRSRLPDLVRTGERIAGCVELGVRVTVDASAAAEGAGAESGGSGPGEIFLRRKRAVRDAPQRAAAAARPAVEALVATLRGRAEETLLRPLPAGVDTALLDAVFLVAEDEVEAFEAEVDDAARALAEDACTTTVSGPWPPYSFVGGAG